MTNLASTRLVGVSKAEHNSGVGTAWTRHIYIMASRATQIRKEERMQNDRSPTFQDVLQKSANVFYAWLCKIGVTQAEFCRAIKVDLRA